MDEGKPEESKSFWDTGFGVFIAIKVMFSLLTLILVAIGYIAFHTLEPGPAAIVMVVVLPVVVGLYLPMNIMLYRALTGRKDGCDAIEGTAHRSSSKP